MAENDIEREATTLADLTDRKARAEKIMANTINRELAALHDELGPAVIDAQFFVTEFKQLADDSRYPIIGVRITVGI